MVSFRCMRLLERFLTIQANPAQFCSITISSVSLCYGVHYFSVAFEKITSLANTHEVVYGFFVVLKEFRWNGHVAYGMFGGQHPHLGSEWLQFPVDLCFVGEFLLLCLLSASTAGEDYDACVIWMPVLVEVKQNPTRGSDKSFAVSWCQCVHPYKSRIMVILTVFE